MAIADKLNKEKRKQEAQSKKLKRNNLFEDKESSEDEIVLEDELVLEDLSGDERPRWI